MSEESRFSGGCMCGNVRYEAIGDPMTVAYCHCASCRKHSGAPVVTWVACESRSVRWTKGTRAGCCSSPGVQRSFCRDCGTSLTWEGESHRFGGTFITEFHISTLDDPNTFVPDRHWFDDERLTWFDTDDLFPRYAELDGGGAKPIRYG